MTKKRSRKQQILDALMEQPDLAVSDLSQRFGVSEVTIRSDLKSLAAQGLILRQHGGGFPALHVNVTDRQRTHTKRKRASRAGRRLIENLDDVMITGDDDVPHPPFSAGAPGVNIVTNSTLLLPYIRSNPACSSR
jgi:DeoR family galactitol utilization operon repressor